jgi:hypothetical protein
MKANINIKIMNVTKIEIDQFNKIILKDTAKITNIFEAFTIKLQ